MILTPVDPAALQHILDVYAGVLEPASLAQTVFARIAATRAACPGLVADLHAGRAKAIALAHRLGIPTCDEAPEVAFSWDGCLLRTRSETSVVFHEIAHWQLTPVERRGLPDFGLGAGPETGRVAEADAATSVSAITKEHHEDLASLLGILWEVEYAEPALIAFAEQNWFELYERASTPAHFVQCLRDLQTRGLISDDGRPLLTVSAQPRSCQTPAAR